jgi:5-hydroxyisourate hydrolase
MSGISTHVLDTTLGKPASGIKVRLERADAAGMFHLVAERSTDAQGRVADFLGSQQLTSANYRLRFETGDYLRVTHQTEFYPHVEILFHVTEAAGHYHIPLLLSPFGYSTYRGS